MFLVVIICQLYAKIIIRFHPLICFLSGFDIGFLQKSIMLDCETQIESLLASVFENYKSLDESSPSGLADLFGLTPESAAPALAPAVQVYTLLRDILTVDAQTMLRNYLQVHEKSI